MATAEATPLQPTRVEPTTYCLVQTGTKVEEGKNVPVVEFMTESAANKAVEEKKGEIMLSQTWGKNLAENSEGFAILVPDESERVKLFNRGADNKQYQIIRARMLETDEEGQYVFQPVEGAIDLAKELAAPSRSRATSPDAKVEKVLEGLDEDAALQIIERLKAKLMARSAQPVSSLSA